MRFVITISTNLLLLGSSNFILFNGTHIHPYVLKSWVVKVRVTNLFCVVELFITSAFFFNVVECKQHLGLPPYGKISASTSWPYRRRASCQPEDGYLMSNKGWCSRKRYSQYWRKSSENSCNKLLVEHDQWLEFDLGHPSTVTSLITKGRGDTSQEQWVTKYKVSFSNDSRLWLYYKDKSQIEPKV